MGNFQDFYKMDKICTSIYPDSEAHILNFCFSPEHAEPADTAAPAAHCCFLVDPYPPPHPCLAQQPPHFFPYEACASSSHHRPFPCATFSPFSTAPPTHEASLFCLQQTLQFFTSTTIYHSSGRPQQPSATQPWPAIPPPHQR